jgi:hypothetical protein
MAYAAIHTLNNLYMYSVSHTFHGKIANSTDTILDENLSYSAAARLI